MRVRENPWYMLMAGSQEGPAIKIMVASYFGGLCDNLDAALRLPVAGLHVDLVRAPELLSQIIASGE